MRSITTKKIGIFLGFFGFMLVVGCSVWSGDSNFASLHPALPWAFAFLGGMLAFLRGKKVAYLRHDRMVIKKIVRGGGESKIRKFLKKISGTMFLTIFFFSLSLTILVGIVIVLIKVVTGTITNKDSMIIIISLLGWIFLVISGYLIYSHLAKTKYPTTLKTFKGKVLAKSLGLV